MNFALIIDTAFPVPSYYVKDNKAYELKSNNEYSCDIRTLDSECFISTWNYPWLFDGYFINWSEFKHDLPDLDLDLIFVAIERCLGREDEYPWIKIKNLKEKYPKAKIVGFIKEIWVGPPYDYNHPKHLARLDFLNQCDAIIHNRPELKEFQNIKNFVNVPFNFIGQPHNIDYFYDNFGKNKHLAIWLYEPHRMGSRGKTTQFAKYISKKYNIPIKHKQMPPDGSFHIPLRDFIKQWSSCIFHFNLDPIDYYPGKQAVHCASVGSINIGGLNDNHKLLFPKTATNDFDILEKEIIKYIEDSNYRNKTIQYAWQQVNNIFGFESVKEQIKNIKYKI